MKLILKVILLSRPKEQGFVLPVIIALGLIMTLLGTISIFQSSDEQLTASSQRATSKALAAAEIGVNHYRELIDSNKIIATYPACDGTWATNGSCNESGTKNSWKQATSINNIDASCPANSATVIAASTRTWQTITAGSPKDGQYRLIDYQYTPGVISSGSYTTQPIGTLTVEGRVNQNNTQSSEVQAAVARVEVDLPIQPGIPTPGGEQILLEGNFNHLHPALWITDDANGVKDSRGLKVNGNIVVTDTDGTCKQDQNDNNKKITINNLQNSNNQAIILTPIDLQVAPYGYRTAPLTNVNALTHTDVNNGITLPRPGQNDLFEYIDSNTNGLLDLDEEVYYHYNVTGGDIDLTNKSIKIVAGRKVILYVDNNIILNADGASERVDINYDTTDPSANPSYFLEIYGGTGTQEIKLKGGSGSANNEKITIKAFIHAPNAEVQVQGNPIVNIKGAVWVKDWDGSNNLNTDVVIEPDSANGDDVSKQYYSYTYIRDNLAGPTSTARVVDPVISVPSRWETQQAE